MTMTTLAVIDIVGKDNYWTIAITAFMKKHRFFGSQANLVLNSDIELSRNLVFTITVVQCFYRNNLFNCSLEQWPHTVQQE